MTAPGMNTHNVRFFSKYGRCTQERTQTSAPASQPRAQRTHGAHMAAGHQPTSSDPRRASAEPAAASPTCTALAGLVTSTGRNGRRRDGPNSCAWAMNRVASGGGAQRAALCCWASPAAALRSANGHAGSRDACVCIGTWMHRVQAQWRCTIHTHEPEAREKRSAATVMMGPASARRKRA